MDFVGEGERGMIWENGIETCTILDAWGWCTGTMQRNGMGREEGGGFRMRNTCGGFIFIFGKTNTIL